MSGVIVDVSWLDGHSSKEEEKEDQLPKVEEIRGGRDEVRCVCT